MKMTDHKKTRIGQMLRLYRAQRKQGLRAVAPEIGISSATLMRIEVGFDMDAATLVKLLVWMRAEETP